MGSPRTFPVRRPRPPLPAPLPFRRCGTPRPGWSLPAQPPESRAAARMRPRAPSLAASPVGARGGFALLASLVHARADAPVALGGVGDHGHLVAPAERLQLAQDHAALARLGALQ